MSDAVDDLLEPINLKYIDHFWKTPSKLIQNVQLPMHTNFHLIIGIKTLTDKMFFCIICKQDAAAAAAAAAANFVFRNMKLLQISYEEKSMSFRRKF